MSLLKYRSVSSAVTIIILLSYLSIENNYNSFQSAVAQQQKQNSTSMNTNTTTATTVNQSDTFQAKGQINSLSSNTFLGKSNSINPNIWILGGNWQFGVKKGNLTNFNVTIFMTRINGTEMHVHNIDKLINQTGSLIPSNSSTTNKKIILSGNYTKFAGIANITVNGSIKWKDVPISVTLRNGNTITFDIDPAKTNYHFQGLPVFGIVNSLVGQNGKELINRLVH